MRLHKVDKEVLLRVLVYGGPGVGKTTFVNTFDHDPRSARVLHLNAAGNPIRLRMMTDPAPIIVDLEQFSDLNLVYSFLHAGQPAEHPLRQMLGLDKSVKFGTVAVDTLTEVQLMLISEVSKTPPDSFVLSDAKISFDEWYVVTNRIRHMTRLFFALPIHVILVTQERMDVDLFSGDRGIMPLLQGSANPIVQSYAEIVGRMIRRPDPKNPNIVNSVLILEGGQGMGKAKNQVDPRLGRDMVDPTAKKIFDVLYS